MMTNDAVDFLLNKEIEIDNRIVNTVSDILRLGYNSERGKQCIKDLRKQIEYSLDEIDRVLID